MRGCGGLVLPSMFISIYKDYAVALGVCIHLMIIRREFFSPFLLEVPACLLCYNCLIFSIQSLFMDSYRGSPYENRTPHDWNDPSAQIAVERRASDTEYDVRSPGQYYHKIRPTPSYYAQDFQSVEQGRSSSFTGSAHRFENPNIWENRPQPYPGEAQRDYDYYKYDRQKAREIAKKSCYSVKKAGIQPQQSDCDHGEQLRDLATELILRANEYVPIQFIIPLHTV